MEQLNMFDTLWERYKIKKEIKLIELFAGYGSQHLALKYNGANFMSHRIAEWAIKSIQAYKDLHCPDDNTDYSIPLTKESIVDFLFKKGISSNYNDPMTREQIAKLNETQLRTIYNNIVATKNLVSVCNIHAADLDITEKDKYEYVVFYSFPCQDLSIAGLSRGMKKGSGTRSGLLWEVERILHELKAKDQLPQVLLMENVPLVHGEQNWNDFNAWKKSLTDLGYCNFWQDLSATDFDIPQTRVRTFMVSILGDYNYNFPQGHKLKTRLMDMLDTEVDEKYFLSDKMIAGMQHTKFNQYKLENRLQNPEGVIDCLTTRTGEGVPHCIAIKNATKKGYLEAHEGDGVDISGRMQYHRGTVQKGMSQTITTAGGDNVGVVVRDPRVIGGVGEKKSNGGTQYYQQDRIYEGDMAISISTGFNPFYKIDKSKVQNMDFKAAGLCIRKLTPRECFRLMGVKDEDFARIAEHQTESSLYHLAGDSIVVNVLMAIFNELL